MHRLSLSESEHGEEEIDESEEICRSGNGLDSEYFEYVCVVCFFVRVFRPTREYFTRSYGDVVIASEGLQILTYIWHSWPFGSDVPPVTRRI